MILLIQLDRVDANCLVPHLIPDSDFGKGSEVFLGNTKVKNFYCTESESFELLQIAQNFALRPWNSQKGHEAIRHQTLTGTALAIKEWGTCYTF